MKIGYFSLIAVVMCATVASADIESGPKAGDKVAALKVLAVTGPSADKEVDYAKDRQDDMTVYLFVDGEKFSRPMNRFIKELDGKLPGYHEKAKAVFVWVGDTDKAKEFLPRVQMSVKYENVWLNVGPAEAGKAEGWGINPDAHLTVVVAHKGKIIKSFAFESVNETDVAAVEKVIKAELK
jgi:hypothetical protein